MARVDRLSAIPLFLRQQAFWAGALDPKTHLAPNSKYRDLSLSAGSHRWDVDRRTEPPHVLSSTQLGLVDIAQSILERGSWTAPSWRIEKKIADLFASELDWEIKALDPERGSLGFEVIKSKIDESFKQALVSARWQVEAETARIDDLWASQSTFDEGSTLERQFLDYVLVPALGYPLLDYLRLQVSLPSLGLDPIDFTGQRTDFVIDTYRGIKLVIEVDGGQHRKPDQVLLDKKRDKALSDNGWCIWRVSASELLNYGILQKKLKSYFQKPDGSVHWGINQPLNQPRQKKLMNCVWGATSCARMQFLLLEALRNGLLPWDEPWHVHIVEHDTDLAQVAVDDFADWFGRLRELYGMGEFPGLNLAHNQTEPDVDLLIDLSIINPYLPATVSSSPVAWSRPANEAAPSPKRRFSTRMVVSEEPSEALVTAFVQDLFRKTRLRDGQNEIIGRILRNQDVIGLLPTGGGKSLTYYLCGLLLGGMTVYVSPLKSLLQDQRERLIDCGIDLAVEISSALTTADKAIASHQLIGGGVRFLLIAPERFLIDQFRIDLAQFRAQWGEISQVVIDECHCVSEWGHDFRPAYLSLSRIVKDRTNRLDVSAPLIALTGTASSIVLADVRRELGVIEDGAVIRAKKLDRPEINMMCVKLPQKQKHPWIQKLVHDFLINSKSPREGLLVFCRFIGSTEGVLNISSELLASVPTNAVRFYCGKSPDWRKYAAFRTKTKTLKIDQEAININVPLWALNDQGELKQWELVKATVQRNFISGMKDSFPILVATTAFGMGIDKPSIRQVIHVMTPQSPEAYYQEVGRAGRDKIPSQAILLFSDEDASLTDSILSPGVNIDEARQIYEDFKKKNQFGGGDFIRTFWFHQNSFHGPEHEAHHISALLKAIRKALTESTSLIFSYHSGDTDGDDARENTGGWTEERNLEYAVVRLIILGVVKDYTKDYNSKALQLALAPEWEAICDDAHILTDYYGDHFRKYAQKYQIHIEAHGEKRIRQAKTIEALEIEASTAIVTYVYEQIERKRREASRQMLELARKATTDPDEFRQMLLFYLQALEKFTRDLEFLAKNEDISSWKQLLDRIETPDEITELHGACQRVNESFPTHPGLRAISAVTRRNPSPDGIRRSQEEFNAALKFCTEAEGIAKAKTMGNTMINYAELTDVRLNNALQSAFGIWLLQNGFADEAHQRFFIHPHVRNAWITSVLKEVNDNLPEMMGL